MLELGLWIFTTIKILIVQITQNVLMMLLIICINDEKCGSDNESDDGNDSDISECSDNSLIISATLNECPVHTVFLEEWKTHLIHIMGNDILLKNGNQFFQIIVQLITYQNLFDFTHNDLHTNNVMYNTTQKPFLYYLIKGKYYKVPTFGKIYKIIDFGRAIYKFKGVRICSDSYSLHGDAHTQYNCEPFFNHNKRRIEPNYAFDLCRLGCSLYDYFDEEYVLHKLDASNELHEIAALVKEWCTDDNGMNILYKNSGRDRYPGFKLYKMIARTVSKHTPEAQLNKELFDIFKISRTDIGKRTSVMNIDELPQYV